MLNITNPNKYPEYIMEKLRQRIGREENDTGADDMINEYLPSSAFSEVCEWEGLFGYAEIIKSWIKDIYGVNLDKNDLG